MDSKNEIYVFFYRFLFKMFSANNFLDFFLKKLLKRIKFLKFKEEEECGSFFCIKKFSFIWPNTTFLPYYVIKITKKNERSTLTCTHSTSWHSVTGTLTILCVFKPFYRLMGFLWNPFKWSAGYRWLSHMILYTYNKKQTILINHEPEYELLWILI